VLIYPEITQPYLLHTKSYLLAALVFPAARRVDLETLTFDP